MRAGSRKRRVFDWLHRNEFDEGLLYFEDVMHAAADRALAMEGAQAEKFALVNASAYWTWLLQECAADAERGLEPTFEVKDRSARRLSWFPADLEACLSSKEKHRRLMLRARPHMMRAIDKLDYRQYEALGCFICRLLGGERVLLTPRSDEGGIDFFATLAQPERAHVFFGTRGRLRIIGQCKKYSDGVEPSKVREMITSINKVKHRESALKVVPAWFHATGGPIVGWMIGHSGFTSGARSEAKAHGIIVSDSRDLAQIAALSRSVPVAAAPTVRGKALLERARQELELHEDDDHES